MAYETKNIVVLGSTGSIGENVLNVVRALHGRICVKGLAADRNSKKILEQAHEFGVQRIAMANPEFARECRDSESSLTVHEGEEGIVELVRMENIDLVVCAVVGIASLKPVLAAVEMGTDIALSSKEALVTGGHLVKAACNKSGARILPVDSEHSAIFQCLMGAGEKLEPGSTWKHIQKLILTASGGPFWKDRDMDLETVSIQDVLRHPNWDMGRKVTVDSATMMNKGLEVMEAHWLFDIPFDRIDVVIQPESIIHSLVAFIDGSMLAQLSPPDMRYAIQYALTFPERVDGGLDTVDLTKAGKLTFEKPDVQRFPCLSLARKAAIEGGTMPTVLNAANEVVVSRFLDGAIGFNDIWRIVEKMMERHKTEHDPDLESIMETDLMVRRQLKQIKGN